MSYTHPVQQNAATQTRQNFKLDVETALKAYLPSGQKPYRHVYVLLASWDNAPNHDDEIQGLKDVFKRICNYETEVFRIPLSQDRDKSGYAFKAMVSVLYPILNKISPNDLFIFYYGGHATHEYDKQLNFAQERPCIIHSNPIVVGRRFEETAEESRQIGSASIDLSDIMVSLVDKAIDSDVLYILDCCYASSLAIMGKRELLAATAIDRPAPGAGSPDSFTRVLIETLNKANGRAFTAAQLHAEMTRSYYKNELTTTPVHVELSGAMVTKGSIVLAPLRNGSTAVPPHIQSPRPFGTLKVQPKILLSVHLSDLETPPSVQQWTNWLSSHLPSGTEDTEINMEQFFPGFPSYLLISMPVEVWTVLRGDPANVFVGVVRSGGVKHGTEDVVRGVAGLTLREPMDPFERT